MRNTINTDALKHYRKKKGYMTQEQLADRLSCNKDQVNRWETGRTKKPREYLLNKLTDALGVSWEELSSPPPPPEEKELIPTTQLRTRVRPSTRTALELVSRMFAVRPAAIIEIAPLLFLITAYKSLDDRKKKIDDVKEQLDQIIENSKSAAPHLAPAFNYFGVGDVDDAIEIERESIKRRELFGPFDYYRGLSADEEEGIEKNNPFSNYIESMLDELPDGWIDKEEFYSPDYGVPRCCVSINILRQVIGISGSTEKDQEILRYISDGDIDIYKLLKDKDKLSEPDYLESISKRFEAAKSEREARIPSFDFSHLISAGKEDKS